MGHTSTFGSRGPLRSRWNDPAPRGAVQPRRQRWGDVAPFARMTPRIVPACGSSIVLHLDRALWCEAGMTSSRVLIVKPSSMSRIESPRAGVISPGARLQAVAGNRALQRALQAEVARWRAAAPQPARATHAESQPDEALDVEATLVSGDAVQKNTSGSPRGVPVRAGVLRAAPRGIARDVGWAGRGPIPDAYGARLSDRAGCGSVEAPSGYCTGCPAPRRRAARRASSARAARSGRCACPGTA
jgi:hypothetical protein